MRRPLRELDVCLPIRHPFYPEAAPLWIGQQAQVVEPACPGLAVAPLTSHTSLTKSRHQNVP